EELKKENERLRRLLEEALRSAKRQAAPFSRRGPKAHPQKPGRKAGSQYGRRCRRPVPRSVDEVVDVPLPGQCPHCGGGVQEGSIVSQYQTEIPEQRKQRNTPCQSVKSGNTLFEENTPVINAVLQKGKKTNRTTFKL